MKKKKKLPCDYFVFITKWYCRTLTFANLCKSQTPRRILDLSSSTPASWLQVSYPYSSLPLKCHDSSTLLLPCTCLYRNHPSPQDSAWFRSCVKRHNISWMIKNPSWGPVLLTHHLQCQDPIMVQVLEALLLIQLILMHLARWWKLVQ